MSYFKLINGIKDILRTDARVITITEGEIDDLDAYRQNIPVMAHIVVSSGTVEDNFNVYNVVVSVLDIVVENNNLTEEKFLGNDNRQEVYELTDNILRRFYMFIKRNSIGDDIYISDTPSFDKVLDTETQNRLAGWDLTFAVGVPDTNIDVCVNP
jgi:hypothetical protein